MQISPLKPATAIYLALQRLDDFGSDDRIGQVAGDAMTIVREISDVRLVFDWRRYVKASRIEAYESHHVAFVIRIEPVFDASRTLKRRSEVAFNRADPQR